MKMHNAWIVPAALLLSALLAPAAGAQNAPAAGVQDRAAQVSVAPLRLELAGAETSAVLRVTNPSARAVGVQVRVFGWGQKDGADSFFATSDVMVSPSIIEIAPGQTQIFRVARRDAASDGEKRFRVAVDQLPDPELTSAGEAQARIRFTIPLFVDRDRAGPAQLDWTIDANGLHLSNAGGQTSRVVALRLTDAQGAEVPLERNSLRYVQGGSTITWPIEGPCPAGPASLSGNIDGGTVSATAPSTCN